MDNTIFVSSDLDVVMARIEARKLAKQMGFNTADQARISLAASELARALSWNNEAPGEIIFSAASQNGPGPGYLTASKSESSAVPVRLTRISPQEMNAAEPSAKGVESQ